MTEQPIPKNAAPTLRDSKLPLHVQEDIKKLLEVAWLADSQGLWIEGADGTSNYYVPKTTDKSRALRTVNHLRRLYA